MATYNPLSTNFKDDILADSNDRRKYTQINNSDGTISLQDSTAYKQVGSQYGAKEVNEEREAINNIYANKLVSLDEIDLVTEPGFFVDAQVVKELNSKMVIGGKATIITSGSNINVASTNVAFERPMSDTNYFVIATLETVSKPTNFDKNYDVEVIVSNKTLNGFTVSIMRGTSDFLDSQGIWNVNYIVQSRS